MNRLFAVLVAVLAMGSVANAQNRGGWELLGEERVNPGRDRDVINISHNADFYRNKSYDRLRFAVDGGSVRLNSIRIVFLNGYSEAIQIGRQLQDGQNLEINLPGHRSYLRQIEMVYSGNFDISLGRGGVHVSQPHVKVFGQEVEGHRQNHDNDWRVIARERFDRQEERVQIAVGRDDGRIGQIVLEHHGEPIRVRSLRIHLGNGLTQDVRVDQEMANGERTRPVDITGETRVIERVTVVVDQERRGSPGEFVLFGTDEPGQERKQ